jgi:hypothetical protein
MDDYPLIANHGLIGDLQTCPIGSRAGRQDAGPPRNSRRTSSRSRRSRPPTTHPVGLSTPVGARRSSWRRHGKQAPQLRIPHRRHNFAALFSSLRIVLLMPSRPAPLQVRSLWEKNSSALRVFVCCSPSRSMSCSPRNARTSLATWNASVGWHFVDSSKTRDPSG